MSQVKSRHLLIGEIKEPLRLWHFKGMQFQKSRILQEQSGGSVAIFPFAMCVPNLFIRFQAEHLAFTQTED